jgi:hypothetical protein
MQKLAVVSPTFRRRISVEDREGKQWRADCRGPEGKHLFTPYTAALNNLQYKTSNRIMQKLAVVSPTFRRRIASRTGRETMAS